MTSEFVAVGAVGGTVGALALAWVTTRRVLGPRYRCSVCGATASGPTAARWHAMQSHGYGSHDWFEIMDEVDD